MNTMGPNAAAAGGDDASANAIGQAISAHVLNGDPLPFVPNNDINKKKAVHVKWAGKTIALGTFPADEADEKCARAKALTRAWRSTMRPKPSREWVMLELERLQIRVVSGKVAGGRRDSPSVGSDDGDGSFKGGSLLSGATNGLLGGLDWAGGDMMQGGSTNSSADGGGGLDPNGPAHRPLVGGGSAAAYEVARADHYSQKAKGNSSGPGGNNDLNGGSQAMRRLSGLQNSLGGGGGLSSTGNPQASNGMLGSDGMNHMGGGGGGGGGGDGENGMPQLGGLGVNPNQHYEMLKLHHMNLLNEIQETTLMMNLYQQQQVLQQQQMQNQNQFSDQQGMGNLGGGPGNGMGNLGGGPGNGMGNLSGGPGSGMGGGLGDGMFSGLGNGLGMGLGTGLGGGMDSLQQSSGGLGGGMGGNSFGGNNQMESFMGQQNMSQGSGGMGGLGGDTFDMMQGSQQQQRSNMSNMMQGSQQKQPQQQQSNISNMMQGSQQEEPQQQRSDMSKMIQGSQQGQRSDMSDMMQGSQQGQRSNMSNTVQGSQQQQNINQQQNSSSSKSEAEMDAEERLQKLKEEIAQREREAEALIAATSGGAGMKRKGEDCDESDSTHGSSKRVKQEET